LRCVSCRYSLRKWLFTCNSPEVPTGARLASSDSHTNHSTDAPREIAEQNVPRSCAIDTCWSCTKSLVWNWSCTRRSRTHDTLRPRLTGLSHHDSQTFIRVVWPLLEAKRQDPPMAAPGHLLLARSCRVARARRATRQTLVTPSDTRGSSPVSRGWYPLSDRLR
jgi:hypothetical protein